MDEAKVAELTKEFVRAAVELWPDEGKASAADSYAYYEEVVGMGKATDELVKADMRALGIIVQARTEPGPWKANALRLIGEDDEPEKVDLGARILELQGERNALVERVAELEREREGFLGSEGRIDASWKDKSREEILSALEFQGATTRLSLKNEKALHARVTELEGARERLTDELAKSAAALAENVQLQADLGLTEAYVAELEAGIRTEIDAMPDAVIVRENGADENVLASLAVSVGNLKHDLDEARANSVPGLSHEVLTTYGAPNGSGLTLLGRIEALANKCDRNIAFRKKAEAELHELQKSVGNAVEHHDTLLADSDRLRGERNQARVHAARVDDIRELLTMSFDHITNDVDGELFKVTVPADTWRAVVERIAPTYQGDISGLCGWPRSIWQEFRDTAMHAALTKADAAWQRAEGRLANICQLLGVDYTCEEPETCEQVIKRQRGELAAMRGALQAQYKREPRREQWQGVGHFGKTGEYERCPWCDAHNRIWDRRTLGEPIPHSAVCPWRIQQEALASNAGAPEAAVIKAASLIRTEEIAGIEAALGEQQECDCDPSVGMAPCMDCVLRQGLTRLRRVHEAVQAMLAGKEGDRG